MTYFRPFVVISVPVTAPSDEVPHRSKFLSAAASILCYSLISFVGMCDAIGQPAAQPSACPDGLYEGVPHKAGNSYIKDPYTWAITADFARRFCMPDEFVVSDLKGAEAIAYIHGKPTGKERCETKDGQETCQPLRHGHWLEIYLKTASIQKYDPQVEFYVEGFATSANVFGAGSIERSQEYITGRHRAQMKGEILEPPGMRRPFFGIGPLARGHRVTFSYLAKVSPTAVEERAAALSEHYFRQGWKPDIDLLILEGWSNGSIGGSRYTRPPHGYAIAAKRERDADAARSNFPDGYLHVIHLPKRITDVIDRHDAAAGRAFDDAVRRMVIPQPAPAR